MARPEYDDGYVEDSEEEESMLLGPQPLVRKGLPPPPPLPLPTREKDETVSTIQSPNFTERSMHPDHPPPSPQNPPNGSVSTIQTADFTVDRSVVSEISSFGVGIQSAGQSKNGDSSISTFTPSIAPAKTKPRPRPAYKRKDSSVTDGTPSCALPSSGDTPFPYLHSMPPPPQPVASSSPSFPPTATTILDSDAPRVSDSGVEMLDGGMMDIAERAKLRSRARTQKSKQIVEDDVIELSSEDEISFLSSPKSKAKVKAKKPAASKQSASEKIQAKVKVTRDSTKPSPKKRTKTTHVPDPGFESDVNTVPMPTSDPPLPPVLPHHLHRPSSQLPPSDPPPPPSTSGSSSARSAPRTSQDSRSVGVPRQRHESPFSSPPPAMPRKRKRPAHAAVANGDDSDFGADEDSIFAGANVPGSVDARRAQQKDKEGPASIRALVPSPQVVPETQPPAPAKPKSPARRKRKDDDDEEWDDEPAEKPSRSRKKARIDEEDEEEWGGGGASKSRAKSKKAPKKPAAKGKTPKEKPTKAKAGAKGKGKGKATASKDVVEEPDKGPELVTDGGKDKDREAMPPPPVPAPALNRRGKGPPPVPATDDDATSPFEDPSDKPPSKSKQGKGKQRALVVSDDEDDGGAIVTDVSTNSITAAVESPAPAAQKKAGRKSSGGEKGSKENDAPATPSAHSASSSSTSMLPKPAVTPIPSRPSFAEANRAYTIGAKNTKMTPMSELIRRASSHPGSPFPATSRPVYSPLAKASKSALRRIAPLHPNRRTPPPPPPKVPPKPKSKKMLELEEKWEMELEESVEGWYAMSEEERAQLKRAKRDHEMGFED